MLEFYPHLRVHVHVLDVFKHSIVNTTHVVLLKHSPVLGNVS